MRFCVKKLKLRVKKILWGNCLELYMENFLPDCYTEFPTINLKQDCLQSEAPGFDTERSESVLFSQKNFLKIICDLHFETLL